MRWRYQRGQRVSDQQLGRRPLAFAWKLSELVVAVVQSLHSEIPAWRRGHGRMFERRVAIGEPSAVQHFGPFIAEATAQLLEARSVRQRNARPVPLVQSAPFLEIPANGVEVPQGIAPGPTLRERVERAPVPRHVANCWRICDDHRPSQEMTEKRSVLPEKVLEPLHPFSRRQVHEMDRRRVALESNRLSLREISGDCVGCRSTD